MAWLKYLLEANLYMALCYGVYYLVLRRETYHQLNRFYLLVSTLVSFALPLLQVGLLKPVPVVIDQAVEQATVMPVIITHQQQFVSAPATQPVSYPQTAPIVVENVVTVQPVDYYLIAYIMVALVMLGGLIMKLHQLNKLARGGKHSVADNFNMIELDGDEHAFSFFNYLFISKNLLQSTTIIQHELVHIRQKHSFDMIYIELLKIICWFNPAVYLIQYSLKELHEFIADEKTSLADEGIDNYTHFLITNAYGLPAMSVANSFFTKNLLKKRIMMLHQKRSGNLARLKYLLIIPLLIGMLCCSTLGFAKDYPMFDLAPHTPVKVKAAKITSVAKAKTLQTMVEEALNPANDQAEAIPVDVIAQIPAMDSLFGANAPLLVVNGEILTPQRAAELGYDVKGKTTLIEMIPQEDMASLQILKGKSAIAAYGDKGKNGAILVTTIKDKAKKTIKNDGHPLVFVDGKPFEWKDSDLGFDDNGMAKSWTTLLPPEKEIARMEGFNPEEGKKLYGERGANGVMLITTIEGQARAAAEPKASALPKSYFIDPQKYTYQSLAEIAESFSKQGFRFNYRELDMTSATPLLEIALTREMGKSGSKGAAATFRINEMKELNFVIAVGYNDEGPFVRSAPKTGQPTMGQATQPTPAKFSTDSIDSEGLRIFYKFLVNNIKYPSIARENRVAGKVFVSFNVDADNKPANVKILRSLSAETDAEIVRVVKSGTMPVNLPKDVNFVVPVNFLLQEQDSGEIAPAASASANLGTTSGPAAYNPNSKNLMLKEIVVRGYVRK